MPIACTRCGNKEEGEILSAPIKYNFKHGKGCGAGIGPLAVIKGKIKKVEVIPEEEPARFGMGIVDTQKPKKKEKFKPNTNNEFSFKSN